MASDVKTALSPEKARVRSPEEVRAEIAKAREELATAAQALRTDLQETLDWRAWVRKHPEATLIGAFVVGYWLGSSRD